MVDDKCNQALKVWASRDTFRTTDHLERAMGKGDQRTKRGKIFRGTFGNSRPRKKNKPAAPPERAPRTQPPRPPAAT
jgi:30S ribosomal protein S31